jgi:hypothetical protein
MKYIAFFLSLYMIALPVPAQETVPASALPASSCNSEKHHQFDFWIGDWTVSSNGEPAGTNSIYLIHNGCALQENWQGSGAGGVSGTSFNIYDPAHDRWHQTWVDSTGTLLELDGKLIDGKMVLSGERPTRDGNAVVLHRIIWTPNEDGSVRQHWEASKDGGRDWSTLFDGLYIKTVDNL